MTTQDVLESWEKWAYSTSMDERNYDLCDALKAIRASVDATETALKQVLSAIQAYLPPDGITEDECLNRVIACVDPWPAPQPAPAERTGCELGCTTECKAKEHGCASECPALPWQPQPAPARVQQPAIMPAGESAPAAKEEPN